MRTGVIEGQEFAVTVGDHHFFAVQLDDLHFAGRYLARGSDGVEFGHGAS
jgi:hypothetical protein